MKSQTVGEKKLAGNPTQPYGNVRRAWESAHKHCPLTNL
jgi:hypothetical protein